MNFMLAGALVAALPCAHAAGSLRIYGLLDVAVSVKTHQAPGRANTEVGAGLVSGSQFGIEGQEDLGAGRTAFLRLESGLLLDTGAAGATIAGQGKFWNRQAHLGLRQGDTRITLGRQFAAHIDRVVASLDLWGAGGSAHAVPVGLLGINRFLGDNRADDTIALATKAGAWEGSLSASTSEGRGRHRAAELAHVTPGQALTVFGARYEAPDAAVTQGQRPVHASAGLGGQWKVGGFDIVGYAIRARFEAVGRPTESHRVGAVQAARLVLPWLYKVAYTHDSGKDLNGVTGRNGSKQTVVGSVDLFFSKRTRAVLSMAHNSYSAGYRLDPLNIAALGRDPAESGVTAVALGLRHSF